MKLPCLSLAIAMTVAASVVRGATCPSSTIGLDPTAADTVVVEYLDRCVGQVFVAPESLLVSLTVWRPAAPALDSGPRHLIIIDVDSTGAPIPNSVVIDGGSIVNFTGDGIHPVPYRFQFDPPAVLPHRGRYCFVVTYDACDAAIGIMASDDDPYADGIIWSVRTNPFAGCVYPSGVPSPMNHLIDIIFHAEFCGAATPTLRRSWGDLKVLYR